MMVEFGCLRVPVERCRFFTVTQPCKTVKSVGARVLMSLATASHENVFNASIELSRRREPEKEKYIQHYPTACVFTIYIARARENGPLVPLVLGNL